MSHVHPEMGRSCLQAPLIPQLLTQRSIVILNSKTLFGSREKARIPRSGERGGMANMGVWVTLAIHIRE